MSNVLINSNQNSALVATILESSNAIKNPFVYAEDNSIPPHSIQFISVPPTNPSQLVMSGTLEYDLPKNGLIRRIYVDASFTKTTGVDGFVKTGFLFNFESIELLSSGRRISLLTTEGMAAIAAGMPDYVRRAYERSWHMGKSTAPTATDVNVDKVCFPIDMFFSEGDRYALNTAFTEPLRIRIKLGNGNNANDGGVSKPHSITQCNLQVEFRELPNNYTDALIEENYGDGMLTQLIKNYTYETPKAYTGTSTATEFQTFTVDLKENGAVKAMYIMCYMPHDADAAVAKVKESDQFVPISNVKLTASGQTIMDVPAELLYRWGKSKDGYDRCYSTSTALTDVGGVLGSSLENVLKLDFGIGGDNCSNVISFRELSNPQLEITLKPTQITTPFNSQGHNLAQHAGEICRCQVVYEVQQLMTTQSSTGRINLSLSN